MEFNYGHLLEVGPTGGLNRFRYQNFSLPGTRSSQSLDYNSNAYNYLPFGFGGAMATLTGDKLDATLQFANTRIARNFVVEALENTYVCKVTTVLWNASTYSVESSLYEYFGSASSGGWNETTIQIKLNSIIDAVEANVPGRRLRRQQVGNLPFTANVSV
jgi:hypothetical protein